jgi:hypothetical protein
MLCFIDCRNVTSSLDKDIFAQATCCAEDISRIKIK